MLQEEEMTTPPVEELKEKILTEQWDKFINIEKERELNGGSVYSQYPQYIKILLKEAINQTEKELKSSHRLEMEKLFEEMKSWNLYAKEYPNKLQCNNCLKEVAIFYSLGKEDICRDCLFDKIKKKYLVNKNGTM